MCYAPGCSNLANAATKKIPLQSAGRLRVGSWPIARGHTSIEKDYNRSFAAGQVDFVGVRNAADAVLWASRPTEYNRPQAAGDGYDQQAASQTREGIAPGVCLCRKF